MPLEGCMESTDRTPAQSRRRGTLRILRSCRLVSRRSAASRGSPMSGFGGYEAVIAVPLRDDLLPLRALGVQMFDRCARPLGPPTARKERGTLDSSDAD